jgi:hypothetical protein
MDSALSLLLRMALTTDTETVRWREAVRRMNWKQGEHTTLIGPTGRGKTELTVELLKWRKWALFLGTKRRDSTQDRLRSDGFKVVTGADGINPDYGSKLILRPPFPKKMSAASLKALQQDVFREGLMRAFHQTGWTVAMDEARYITHFLGLEREATLLWLQGRSQGNSVICSTQRPRFVPLEAYDQATHLFLWTDSDRQNLTRTSELAGFNGKAVREAFQEMDKHDVLYVNTVNEDMFITNTRW